MTKYFEEFIRTEIDLIDAENFKLKGELTIVISENKSFKKVSSNLDESDKRFIKGMINKLSIKEIADLINQKKISKKKFIIIV